MQNRQREQAQVRIWPRRSRRSIVLSLGAFSDSYRISSRVAYINLAPHSGQKSPLTGMESKQCMQTRLPG